jgi:hypothetical protein
MRMQIEDVSFEQSPTIESCFPSSTKIFKTVEHANGILEVPFRRINLTGGSGHLDVQDTSGAQARTWTRSHIPFPPTSQGKTLSCVVVLVSFRNPMSRNRPFGSQSTFLSTVVSCHSPCVDLNAHVCIQGVQVIQRAQVWHVIVQKTCSCHSSFR